MTAAIPWVKQQDFCLRLGLLRALLAVLPAHERSVDRAPILRRLNALLFAPLKTVPILEARAHHVLGGPVAKPRSQPGDGVSVADGLIVTSGNSSWGQPVDEKHSAKILEWGQASGMIGRGNQLSERGRLLRSFFEPEAVAAFARGDVTAWNPFEIPPVERLFLLFHLGELDEVLWRVAVLAGLRGVGAEVDASEARLIAAKAMAVLVLRIEKQVPMGELARLRVLRELTRVVEAEAEGRPVPVTAQWGPPKPARTRMRATRQTTKSADHQAVPRFEMLVDIGLVEKVVPTDLAPGLVWKARNAWSFRVTPAGSRFAEAVSSLCGDPAAPWHWTAFARAAAAAEILGKAEPANDDDLADLVTDSYERISRRTGHTPLESVALLAMLEGLRRGVAIEMDEIHRAFLKLKTTGALEAHVSFAARNELDRMFVQFRPTAREALRAWLKERRMTQ